MSTGKKVLIGFGIFMGLGVIGQVTGGNRKTNSPVAPATAGMASQAAVSAPAPAPAEQALTVGAAQLVRAYEGNEVGADEAYKGKLIAVTGRVDSIGKDIMDDPYITIAGGHPIRQIQVFFEDAEQRKLGGLSKGQTVTVQGRCAGLMMNVLLRDAVLQ